MSATWWTPTHTTMVVVGAFAVLVVATLLIVWCCSRRRRNRAVVASVPVVPTRPVRYTSQFAAGSPEAARRWFGLEGRIAQDAYDAGAAARIGVGSPTGEQLKPLSAYPIAANEPWWLYSDHLQRVQQTAFQHGLRGGGDYT